MAITLVGETTELISAATTENVPLPGTLQEGDLVLVGVGGDRTYTDAITTAGYTQIHETLGTATAPQCTLEYKFMGATPDSTVAIQNDQSGGCRGVVCIKVFRGVDQTTPLDVAAVVATGSTGMPDAGSLTPVTNGAMRVLFGVLDDDEITDTTLPATFANLLNQETTGGGDTLDATAMMCQREEATAGALDPAAFGGSGSDDWVCVHIALRPAATGSTTPETISASATGTASLALVPTWAAAMAVTVTGTPSLVKAISKALGVVATATAALGKAVAKAMAVTATATASQAEALIMPEAVSVTATATATMAEVFTAFTGLVRRLIRKLIRPITRPITRPWRNPTEDGS